MIKPGFMRGPKRRPVSYVLVAFIISTLLLGMLSALFRSSSTYALNKPWSTDSASPMANSDGSILVQEEQASSHTKASTPWATLAALQRKIHILLPATQSNVNLCKTLLSMTILGYPNPTIVAWGDEDKAGVLLGGGSHYAKITRTLDYINDEERRKDPAFDDELVFMLDSYDIWFQLPIDVLISRYDTIVRDENARVAHRMGRAYDNEGIDSAIIFGGGKRCSPNQIHSLSCYPIPDSPLPMDLYNGNTDTLMGRNIHSSFRTRYLNSGYMIGPVRRMRPLLERAVEKLNECVGREGAPFDNGSRDSDHCYRGSDQSIFVEMYGEQEFHREVMRRQHRTGMDDMLDKLMTNRSGAWPPPSHILDAPVRDYLNPDFTHQENDPTYLPGTPYEFGIGVDYWSDLGHQTSNAEWDHRWLWLDQPLEPQIGDQGMFDCPIKAPMPNDLPDGPLELFAGEGPDRWESLKLYFEVCVGRAPVMIHHNSIEKWRREDQWRHVWWNGRGRALLEEQRRRGAPQLTFGIPTDSGAVMPWEELCPPHVEPELFRDVPEPPPPPPPPEETAQPEPPVEGDDDEEVEQNHDPERVSKQQQDVEQDKEQDHAQVTEDLTEGAIKEEMEPGKGPDGRDED